MKRRLPLLLAFVSGVLFASGLAISGMVMPSKVIGFLDITGAWDPSLAFVMGGALMLFVPGYRLARSRTAPVVGDKFDLPTQTKITPSLLAGAALFGVGWGISGMCPAAAIAAVPTLAPGAIAVTVGMSLGILAMRTLTQWTRRAKPEEPPPVADF